MECSQFEELISEYLDFGLTRPVRRDFAEHLLACRNCHLVFNDVRDAMDACHHLKESQMRQIALFTEVEQRILNATSAGEMLSCRTLDVLISDYYDGIIETSYEEIFQKHFAVCDGCRRLVDGVRESMEESETLDVPEELFGRILRATSGARR